MDQALKRDLQILATKIRMGAIEGTYNAKSGHPGGSLSIAELLAYLYTVQMKYDAKNPKWEDRDRLVLSKGHTAPSLYTVLAEKGFFPKEEIKKLRHTGEMLQGHPDMKGTPGIDMSTGSLGQGISAAAGMTLGAKLSKEDWKVYTIVGDGELQEGQVWEAAMFSAHKNLENLCVIVDNNNLQIDGTVEEINSPYPIDKKFEAFGFHVINIDGHNFDEIDAAFKEFATVKGKPTAIIQKSIKGKDVSFMENEVGWHGTAPNKEQYDLAMKELNEQLNAFIGGK